ncbi:MAG: hypothetical protein QOG97_1533 [Acidimicrobiaceae bacterium]|nr:hypothetical protein [Acidimicrobiaceae bacterium]MDQ1441305.1 hypothetical protein [Acidimicrobiaceae bacterium]
MQLVSQVPTRPVLLVLDDKEGSIADRLHRASPLADVVTRASSEGAWSALTSGRRYSAVVAFGVDHELADAATRLGIPVIGVGPESATAERDLAATIAAVAAPVAWADHPNGLSAAPACAALSDRPGGTGRLLAVCGPGGTGASLVAAGLSWAFGSAGWRRRVLLADFARRSDQAFLHGLEDPPAGLLQLVNSGRYRPIAAADVRRHTVARPGFRLLPGLRRPAHWTAVSPSAFDQLVMVLPELFDLVVADITGDFEGEADSGSCDVEERNHIARRSARAADTVVVVGGARTNGARRLSQVVDELLDLGVDPARIQPAVRCDEFPVCTHRKFSRPSRICGLPSAPVELATVAGAPGRLLPPEAVWPLAEAVTDLLSRLPAPDRRPDLVPVVPGSLGCLAP